MKRDDYLERLNDFIVQKRQYESKSEPVKNISRHGAPLVEGRYYMPVPRKPRQQRRIREGLSQADLKRAGILRNHIQEGLARLQVLRNKLVKLEGGVTAPLDPLRQMLESRRQRRGLPPQQRPSRTSKQPIRESAAMNAAPPNYIPPSQRYNVDRQQVREPKQGNVRTLSSVRESRDRENPTPRDPQKWAELENKILGGPQECGPDSKISRMMSMPNEDMIMEDVQDEYGPGTTASDVDESGTDQG